MIWIALSALAVLCAAVTVAVVALNRSYRNHRATLTAREKAEDDKYVHDEMMIW